MSHQKKIVKKSLSLAITAAIGLASNAYSADIQIASMDLSDALKTLSKQSGVEIIFNPNNLKSITTQEVNGNLDTEEALALLLNGTNQTYQKDSNNVYIIQNQEAGGDSSSEDAIQEVEEIITTGSLLRGVEPTSQKIVFDQEEMKRQGIFSAEDLLRSLPQQNNTLNSHSSRFNDTAGGWSPNDTQGNSAANLRGVGTQGTLVLIDGRRVAGAAIEQGQYVNLANIPMNSIERVEILLDGASAIYGSDAIAGVINFIRKKDYIGATTTARIQDSVNGGNEYELGQSFGTSWDSGSFSASLNYTQVRPTSTAKAGWTSSDHSAIGGTDNRRGFEYQPGQISTGWRSSQQLGSLPADFDGTEDWTTDDLSELNLRPADSVSQHFGSESKRYAFNADISQDLFDGFEARASIYYTLGENEGINMQPSVQGAEIPPNNAFNNLDYDALEIDDYDVESDYFFVNEVLSGRMRHATTITEHEDITLSLGFNWDLPFLADWQWRFDIAQSRSTSSGTADGIERPEWLENPDYEPGSDDPERREQYLLDDDGLRIPDNVMAELLSNSDPNTALNLFGNGYGQPESVDLNSLYVNRFNKNPESYTRYATSVFEGPVFAMPSGQDSRLGLGIEYREEWIDYKGDLSRAINAVTTPGGDRPLLNDEGQPVNEDGEVIENIITQPKQSITAVYFNWSLPIIGIDNALPGIESLDLNLAGRYEEYEVNDAKTGGTFDNFSPKIGISWEPTDQIRVFANWSESFLAPDYDDLLPSHYLNAEERDEALARQYPSSYSDPYWEDIIDYPEVSHPNYPYASWGAPERARVPSTTQGDPNLKPEISKNTSVGINWHPDFLEGFDIEVVYNEIDYQDRLTHTRIFYDEYIKFSFEGVAIRDERNGLIGIIDRPVNISKTRIKTTDVRASYDWKSDWGNFSINLNSSYTGLHEDQITPLSDPFQSDGTQRGPEQWKHLFSASMSRDDWGASLITHYSSSYQEFDRYGEPFQRVEHYVTHDLTGWYHHEDSGFRLYAGVRDITNQHFPFEDGYYPFNLRVVDPKGRTVFFKATKNFSL